MKLLLLCKHVCLLTFFISKNLLSSSARWARYSYPQFWFFPPAILVNRSSAVEPRQEVRFYREILQFAYEHVSIKPLIIPIPTLIFSSCYSLEQWSSSWGKHVIWRSAKTVTGVEGLDTLKGIIFQSLNSHTSNMDLAENMNVMRTHVLSLMSFSHFVRIILPLFHLTMMY